MAARIIHSPYLSIPLPKRSIHALIFTEPLPLPNHPALIDGLTGKTITHAELHSASLQLAWGLREQLGIKRGETMLVLSPNSLDFAIAIFGALAAGVRVSPANSSYSPTELAHQLTDCNATLIFAHPSLLPTLKDALIITPSPPPASQLFSLSPASHWTTLPSYTTLMRPGRERPAEKFDGEDAHETAFLCYSSGTTGRSKGVETTHFNVVSDLLIVQNRGFPPVSPGDVQIGFLPMFHIFGLVKVTLFSLLSRTPLVILPRFDPAHFGRCIEQYKVSVCMVVPPVLVHLATTDLADRFDLSSIRLMMSAAAPLGGKLSRRVRQKLKDKVTILQAYGLTETSPCTHLMPAHLAATHPSACGVLLSNTEARIVDEYGKDAAWDGKASGEVWIRGPMVMKGYLNRPEETSACMTADGFFKTGDVATYDAATGLFSIVDRLKELIKYKGFQVPPAELEALLLSNPEIVDAAVVGVYDEAKATELPRAYVVPAKDVFPQGQASAWAARIQQWVAERVSVNKKLRGGVVLLDTIPKRYRSPAGKILRRKLRELAKLEVVTEARAKL